MAMHYGQGALAGGLRGLMAWAGVRGPFADFMFMGLRLAIDQSLENGTGVGALPWLVVPSLFFLFWFCFVSEEGGFFGVRREEGRDGHGCEEKRGEAGLCGVMAEYLC